MISSALSLAYIFAEKDFVVGLILNQVRFLYPQQKVC